MNPVPWKTVRSDEEKRRIWRTTRNLSPSACYRETNEDYEDSDKGTGFGEFFADHPSKDILHYPEERDDKGEQIKAWRYLLLRRAVESKGLFSG